MVLFWKRIPSRQLDASTSSFYTPAAAVSVADGCHAQAVGKSPLPSASLLAAHSPEHRAQSTEHRSHGLDDNLVEKCVGHGDNDLFRRGLEC